MSLPMTQILAPACLTTILSGSTQYNSDKQYTLSFPPYNESGFTNEVNLAGSGCSGQYLGNIATNGNFNTKLKVKGSGGGNLTGLPNIIYLNLTGSLEVIAMDVDTKNPIGNPDILHFTGLLQLTMNGQQADLSLVNPYAEVQSTNSAIGKTIFESIELGDPVISVTCVNNMRYILLGDFTLTFQIS